MNYNHKEAFCLMTYAPEKHNPLDFDVQKVYKIWNSRDGVTPYNYPINREMCVHVEWNNDRFLPDYKINVGDMYWRDKTGDEAKAEAIRRIEAYKGTPYEVKDEDYDRILNALISSVIEIPVLDIYK